MEKYKLGGATVEAKNFIYCFSYFRCHACTEHFVYCTMYMYTVQCTYIDSSLGQNGGAEAEGKRVSFAHPTSDREKLSHDALRFSSH